MVPNSLIGFKNLGDFIGRPASSLRSQACRGQLPLSVRKVANLCVFDLDEVLAWRDAGLPKAWNGRK